MKIFSASPTWNVLLPLVALLLPSGVSPVPATPAHAAPQQASGAPATTHAYGRPAAELYSSAVDQSLPQIDEARGRLERDGRVLRSRFVTVDFDALGAEGFDAAQASIELAPRLALTLFGDRVTVMQERVDLNPAGGFSWIGRVEGEPDSRVVLAVNAGSLSGGITLHGLTFQINPVANDVHVLTELSAAHLPTDLPPIPFAGPPATSNAPLTASNVDLLIVYTPKTESDLGGRDATHGFIQAAVSTVNAKLRDAGFSTELNLVASAVVSYSETNNLRADLEKLTAPADGALDDVHYLLREAYRADLVHLIVSDDVPTACGFGYQMMNDSPKFADRAFSVSQRSCIGVGTTFENLLASSLGLTGDLATARRNLGAAARFRSAEGVAPGEIELVDQVSAARGGRADLRWIQNPTASWYYVAVETSGAVSSKQWYSAEEVCGADGICSVEHDASRFGAGYLWTVRGWNARGNGPWSAPMAQPGSFEAGVAGAFSGDVNTMIAGVEGTSDKPVATATSGMIEASATGSGPVFTTSALTDSNIHVPSNYATMAPPTVGNSYVDPVFGVTVKRLTDATVLSEPGIVPEYSQTSVFNVDDTYLLLYWINNGEFHLYDAAGNHIQLINALDGLSEPRWSRSNPDHLYYHSGNKIRRIDISTMQDVVIQTFSQYSNINFGGGQGDLSDNNRITVVGNNRYVSIYNLDTQTQYGVLDTNQSPINGKSFDSATVAKDGNSFIVGFDANGTNRGNGMELFDLNGNFVSQLQNATAHYAMGRDANGDAVLYTTNSPTWPQQPVGCDNGVVKINLVANPTQTCLLALDWSMEKHLSALGSDGWVYVSTFQDGAQAVAAGPGDDNDPTKWHAYTGEVFRVRGDGSVVERIVHHRSDVSTYYKQPHATISMSGKKLVYASDFNQNGQASLYADSYVINMGPPAPPAPAAPSNLSANAISGTRIDLTWDDNADNETSFRLQRKPQGGSWSTAAWLPKNTTSYSDTGLSSGDWCYRINAWNTAASSSAHVASTPACVSIGSGGGGDPDVPATPSNLVPTAISSTRIDLIWDDNSNNETSFRLQRKPQGGSWSTAAWLPKNTTSFSDTGLSSGDWCYRINAWNTAAYSSAHVTSTPTCVSIGSGGGGDPDVPATPSNLAASAISSTRIDLTWNDNSNNETSFRLQRKPQGGSWSTAAWLPKDTTSFSDTGLSAGSWCYRINAWNTAAASSTHVTSTPRCVSVGGN